VLKTPKDYGMEYEDVEFKSLDGLNIKGWLIKAKSDKLIIQTHPLIFYRGGFSPEHQGWLPLFKTPVDLLLNAKNMHKAGYSVLMFDFRNHGTSEAGITALGLNEYQSVTGAVKYIKSRADLASKKTGFVSFCMGANSTFIAMSKNSVDMKDIKCITAIQPVSFPVFIHCYLKNTFTPLSLVLTPFVNFFVQMKGDYSINEMTPLPYMKETKVPVFFIQAETDPWTDLSDIRAMYDGCSSEVKEIFLIPGKLGRFDGYQWVSEHPEKITEFLGKHMK
jgi:fermentation-respiration switch protein FrsA (DUF1100 family)